jgi:hypothetical protein
MRVRMLRQRMLQQAGAERPLLLQETYELPDVVATSLIATGAAVGVDEAVPAAASEPSDAVPGAASERPPEGRPLLAPETKGRRG